MRGASSRPPSASRVAKLPRLSPGECDMMSGSGPLASFSTRSPNFCSRTNSANADIAGSCRRARTVHDFPGHDEREVRPVLERLADIRRDKDGRDWHAILRTGRIRNEPVCRRCTRRIRQVQIFHRPAGTTPCTTRNIMGNDRGPSGHPAR